MFILSAHLFFSVLLRYSSVSLFTTSSIFVPISEPVCMPFSPQYFLSQQLVELESCSDFFKLKTSAQNEIQAKVVVIAAGAGSFGPNRPPLENIETYEGKSVFYLVTNKYSLITI